MANQMTDSELELKERMEVLLLEMFEALVDKEVEDQVRIDVEMVGSTMVFAVIDVPESNRALCNGKEGSNIKAAVRFAGRLAKKYGKFFN